MFLLVMVAASCKSKVRIVLADAFSVNVLQREGEDVYEVRFVKADLEFAKELVEYARQRGVEIVSVVGHEGTAKLLSQLLQIEIPVNRVNYTLQPTDIVLIFTVPLRLPEGKTLSEEEIKQIADKLNVFVAAELFCKPRYHTYYLWVSDVDSFLLDFGVHVSAKGRRDLSEVARKLCVG